ncbi:hypothetical protein BIV59_01955 [Bacillus sp. MUM 13]|nr:hypothetical protein BIV59_01955 [Bacillus sp. MUM 13]
MLEEKSIYIILKTNSNAIVFYPFAFWNFLVCAFTFLIIKARHESVNTFWHDFLSCKFSHSKTAFINRVAAAFPF